MPRQMRLLTFHHIANFGAALFTRAFQDQIQQLFPEADVRVLAAQTPELAAYERLKTLRPLPRHPLFFARRARAIRQFRDAMLRYDRSLPGLLTLAAFERRAAALDWDAVFVGMDVWNVEDVRFRPTFPNIYWLPDRLRAKKIAYAVSGYTSDFELVRARRDGLGAKLRQFDLIGVRDATTLALVRESGVDGEVPVQVVPDLAFLHPMLRTDVKATMSAAGVDFSRPRVGVVFNGNERLSAQICGHYRAQGYQVVALNGYTRFADVHLGHRVSPPEWLDAFRHVDVVFSDFFHGTIAALMNETPVIGLKTGAHPQAQCKILDVLSDFGLQDQYADPQRADFKIEAFFEQAAFVREDWENRKPLIRAGIERIRGEHAEFQQRIVDVVG